MRVRPLVVCLAALAGCASEAAAEPEATPAAAATVALPELDTIETLSTTAPASTVPDVPGEVALVGDSLMVSAQEELVLDLDTLGVDTFDYDAVEGRRIDHEVNGNPSGVDAVADIAAARDPDVWVIALGTNDVPGFGADSFRADVEALLAEIPVGDPVIWVDTWIEGRIDEARAANAVLREVAATRSEMTVLDWFQYGDDPGLIIGDGIHLTDTGQQRFSALIAAALSA